MQVNPVRNVNFGKYSVSLDALNSFKNPKSNDKYDNVGFLKSMIKEFESEDKLTLSIHKENVNLTVNKSNDSISVHAHTENFVHDPFYYFDILMQGLHDLSKDDKIKEKIQTVYNSVLDELSVYSDGY